MNTHKFSLKLFAVFSIVMVAVMAFTFYIITATNAAPPKSFTGTPRAIHFSKQLSNAAVASSQLKHWSSSFTYQGKTYRYSMVGTNPAKGFELFNAEQGTNCNAG